MMWWNGAGYPGAWWMGLGMIVPLLLLVGLGIGLYYLVRAANRNSPRQIGVEKSGLEVLKVRYVKGEITREDFIRMKQDIENKSC